MPESQSQHPQTNWGEIGNFVIKVGVPSTIALYLVYMMTSGIKADLKNTADSLQEHQVQAADMMKQYEQVRIQSDKQLYVMQRICISLAKTDLSRAECINRQ